MKKCIYLFITIVLSVLYSCNDKLVETVTYKVNEPVFMPAEAFRKSVNVSTEPEEITQWGKMCLYEGYLYVSEPGKGIHIIDNRNPASPLKIGFIELLGNADLAIRNNTLYADALIDLVWFDISNPAKPEFKNRLENVFQEVLPIMENQFGYDSEMCYNGKKEGKIVVGWNLKERTREITHRGGEMAMDGSYYAMNTNSNSVSNGINGSMSRFGLYQDYLYTVSENEMNIFDLKGNVPQKVSEYIPIGWDVETIFSYKDCMFLGTRRGMQIYSVADPLKPEFQSAISHVYGCDPVVVDNDIAYVTVHSNNFCGQNTNDLIIIDVSEIKNPKPIVSYAMTNPKGLGIDKNTLFLCDNGLKIYKLGDPQKLMSNNLAHYKGMDGFDVIPYNNTLMMIADNGLYQYDYSDINNIKQLSLLPIGR